MDYLRRGDGHGPELGGRPFCEGREKSESRVIVFVDAPNVAKSCAELFGHDQVHPLLLARSVADERRLTSVRYYATVRDPAVYPEAAAAVRRRHALIARSGVIVIERALRYGWTWDIDHRSLPDLAGCPRDRRRVRSTPLYDAVATQDTVTLIRGAIRGLLRACPEELAAQIRRFLRRDDDYGRAGKPPCDWDTIPRPGRRSSTLSCATAWRRSRSWRGAPSKAISRERPPCSPP